MKLSYNPLRQLIEIQDWLGSTRITPDALGRAEKVQYPDGREVSYTYGKAGERRSITYPDGKTVFYGYDEQLRLSELKEGDSIITYGYDTVGRLCEKQFPNGTKTTYRYDRKDQLTELLHQDQEGILDRYTYLYDLLGNKTGITKERRGLERESGQYRYGYDALGRLSEIQKDGEIQYRYGYDAFGNRTWKEERGEQTSYQYNALNQLVSERQGEIRKEYGYDKRGNLTAILENGAWKKRYVYGAMNRLEEAVDAAGKQARYQYNGLGHRVGKQESVLPKEKLEKLDPQRRVGMEIGNSRQITYTLDLTRQYYNLLERTEESQSQRYFWDGNVAAYEENGERNYYLQDELGSPLRIEDSAGTIKENYGYGAFGEDLYQNQGKMQPFGYTGYQRDEVSGTYYAQAREYLAESGRFVECDKYKGRLITPSSLHSYHYCFNNSLKYIDLNGLFTTEEGKEAHQLLQEVFVLEYFPNGIPEFPVVGYSGSKTGNGRIDLALFENNPIGIFPQKPNSVEVYEIKPITQSKLGTGNIQRENYEKALRSMGYGIKKPTTFNPNYWVIPRKDVKDEYIVYYTFPEQPGMIYYNHIKNPNPEKYIYKEVEAKEQKSIEKKEKVDGEFLGGLVTVGATILWIIKQLYMVYTTGGPSPEPCPIGG